MAKIDPDEPCPCSSGRRFADCHGPRVVTNQPPKISETVVLPVVPEPDPGTRAVFIREGEGTVVFQGGTTEIAECCGSCGAPLIVGLEIGQVRGLVLKCNNCGSFNDTV